MGDDRQVRGVRKRAVRTITAGNNVSQMIFFVKGTFIEGRMVD